jgi:hypothetical protein
VVGVIVVSVVVLAFRAVHGNLTTDEGEEPSGSISHATSIGPTSTRASTSVSSSEQADSLRSQARSPTEAAQVAGGRPLGGPRGRYAATMTRAKQAGRSMS